MATSTANYSTSQVTLQLSTIWGVMSTLVTDEGAESDSVETLHLNLQEAFQQLVTETVCHILQQQEVSLYDCDESCTDLSHFKGDFFQDARDPYTYHDMDEDLHFDGSIRRVPHICEFKRTTQGFKDNNSTHKKLDLSKLKEYAQSLSLAFNELPHHFKSVDINEEHLKLLSNSN